MVTVVVTVRNRDASRIASLVNSLRTHGGDYSFCVVDYGSSPEFQAGYEATCRDLNVEYLAVPAQGLPWNKCRAINIAARRATTKFITTIDVDIVFPNDPIAYCLAHHEPRVMFHIPCWWLPQDGRQDRAIDGKEHHPGGFQFIERTAFHELGGYDERIMFWGHEDWDWVFRLRKQGYRMVWLGEPYRLYHVWHPPISRPENRPSSVELANVQSTFENCLHPVLTQDWGLPLNLEDRPLLQVLRDAEPPAASLDLEHGKLDYFAWTRLTQLISEHGGLVRLGLGPRVHEEVPSGRFSGVAHRVLKRVSQWAGFREDVRLNGNVDTFFAVLPLLRQMGLRDYYLADDLQRVDLLFADKVAP